MYGRDKSASGSGAKKDETSPQVPLHRSIRPLPSASLEKWPDHQMNCALNPIIPVGNNAKPLVLIARKAHRICCGSFVRIDIVSSYRFQADRWRHFPTPMHWRPIFMTIAPIAGWSGGHHRTNEPTTVTMSRAINCNPPAFSTTFIRPKNNVIYPISPMAKLTLPFADLRRPINLVCRTNNLVQGRGQYLVLLLFCQRKGTIVSLIIFPRQTA